MKSDQASNKYADTQFRAKFAVFDFMFGISLQLLIVDNRRRFDLFNLTLDATAGSSPLEKRSMPSCLSHMAHTCDSDNILMAFSEIKEPWR